MSTHEKVSHYQHASGVEAIDFLKHLDFIRGNAMKYMTRLGQKDDYNKDLKKSLEYSTMLEEYNVEENGYTPTYPDEALRAVGKYLNWVESNRFETYDYERQLLLSTSEEVTHARNSLMATLSKN